MWLIKKGKSSPEVWGGESKVQMALIKKFIRHAAVSAMMSPLNSSTEFKKPL